MTKRDVAELVTANKAGIERMSGKTIGTVRAATAADKAGRAVAPARVPPVDLEEWDVASALTFAAMNRAIADEKVTEVPFEHVEGDPDAGGVRVAGTFGDWSIAPPPAKGDPGASYTGTSLLVHIPVFGPSFTFQNATMEDIPDHVLHVELALGFFEQDVPEGGSKKALKVDLSASGAGETDDEVITLKGMSGEAEAYFKQTGKPWLFGMYKSQVEDALAAQKALFAKVLALADLAADYPKGMYEWMRPEHLGYAVDGTRGTPGTIAVLTAVEGAPPPPEGYSETIPPGLIPEGCIASFAISRIQVLERMLVNALPLMTVERRIDPDEYADMVESRERIPRPPVDAFSVSEATMALTNDEEMFSPPMSLPSLDGDGETKFVLAYPKGALSLTIERRHVVLRIKGATFLLDEDHEATLGYEAHYDLRHGKDGEGRDYILLTESERIPASASIELKPTQDAIDDKRLMAYVGIGMAVAGIVLVVAPFLLDGLVAAEGVEAAEGAESAAEAGEAGEAGAAGAEDGAGEAGQGAEDPQTRGALGEDGEGTGHTLLDDDDSDVPEEGGDAEEGGPRIIEDDDPVEQMSQEDAEDGVAESGEEVSRNAPKPKWWRYTKTGMRGAGVAMALGGSLLAAKDGLDKGDEADKEQFEKDFPKTLDSYLKLTQTAVDATVQWPPNLPDLELKTVELNEALVFGFSQKA